MIKDTKKELSGETDNSSKLLSNEKDLSSKTSSTDNNSIKRAAMQYAKAGLWVLPISPFSKQPMIAFANRTKPLSAEEVEQFWDLHPCANVALQTVDFFVIDVDRHGDVDGMDAIKKLGHPEWFRNTLIETTAHGGVHIYFMKPTDSDGKPIKMKQQIAWRKGVDIKCHPHNYVVASPSRLGDKRYEWINHNPITSAPKELLALILNNESNNNIITPHYTNYTVDASDMSNWASKKGQYLHWIVSGVGDKGSRHDNLTKLFGWLLANNSDVVAAQALAIEANKHTPDPLPDKEVGQIINSIMQIEMRKRNAQMNRRGSQND